MADTKQCRHCGKPVRAHAKFCPHCGEHTGSENASGILSFDDFFEEETPEADEPTAEETTEPATSDDEKNIREDEPEPADDEKETDSSSEEAKARPIFSFRDKERKRKAKLLDDTLELPIEEIQREIARRRERDRAQARSPEEKAAEKQTLNETFEKLKSSHDEPDVLIPEDEILKEEDRQEKKSLFSRARNYLLGIDTGDIEGVDVKKEEALEQEKARRSYRKKTEPAEPIEREEPDRTPESAVLSTPKKQEEKQEPAAIHQEPEKKAERVLSVPVAEEEKKEPVRGPEFSDEQQDEVKKSTWFGTLFDRKRDAEEEELVAKVERPEPREDAREEVPADTGVPAAATGTDGEPEEEKQTSGNKRRNIILAVAAALLLVAGLGLYFTGNYMSDPLRMTEAFEQAVEQEDQNAIAGMLHADGTPVTAETLAPFYAMLENPEYRQTLLSSLRTFNEENGRSEEADVWIEEAGERYFIFNAYQMNIKTFELIPEVTYPNTQVQVVGAEPVSASPDAPAVIGPLLPGVYTVQSVYEGGLNPLHAQTTVELTTENEAVTDDRMTVGLSNVGQFATVSSTQEEAIVLVNGEELGKAKDLGEEGLRIGPFEDPVQVQLRLDTPIGSVTTQEQTIATDGETAAFDTFPNMVEISDYHDEANVIVNGEPTGAQGKDFIPYGRLIGPVQPEDTLQMEMELEGRMTKSNVVTVGDSESLRFSYWKTFEFPWKYSNSIVYLDGESTGQSVYQLAGDDMAVDLLNSYENIQLLRSYPWGTFESNVVTLAEPRTLEFSFNPVNSTLYRQLQDAVVTHLEEDAFAISNLKPDNYSNIEDPLLSERRSYIQNLIDERTRIVRVSDTANFDMNSIQFDDEDTFYARITETYVYHYQEYEAGIFRPIRLEMQEAQEVMQHALRYDSDRGKWIIYENRPRDSMGQGNVESIDLAY